MTGNLARTARSPIGVGDDTGGGAQGDAGRGTWKGFRRRALQHSHPADDFVFGRSFVCSYLCPFAIQTTTEILADSLSHPAIQLVVTNRFATAISQGNHLTLFPIRPRIGGTIIATGHKAKANANAPILATSLPRANKFFFISSHKPAITYSTDKSKN